jgi:hypothetical protein
MRLSNTYLLGFSLLISGSIALSGCDRGAARPINISYRQVGICKRYDTAAGPVRARSDEAFGIFKIEAVDNTKPSESFDFDPTHLHVDQSTPDQKAKKAVWDRNRHFMYPDVSGPEIRPETSAFRVPWKPPSRCAQNVRSMACCRSTWHKQPKWRAGSQSALFRAGL